MSPAERSAALRLLRGALSSESAVPWPDHPTPNLLADIQATAEAEGVLALLDPLWSTGRLKHWPAALQRASRQAALQGGVRELTCQRELLRVLALFHEHRIVCVLLKGTALAYSHYPHPSMRPRGDTDLLVAPAQSHTATALLQRTGYRRVSGPGGEYFGYQVQMHKVDDLGVSHTIDLHWRLSNAQSLAWLLDPGALLAATLPLPALGAHARRLDEPHALLHALLHRAGNVLFLGHDFGNRLIWLYDIHLLVQSLTSSDFEAFVELTQRVGMVAVATDGLRATCEALPSPKLRNAIKALGDSPNAGRGAALMNASGWRREWLEWTSLPSLRARIVYLANHVVPSATFMRETFPDESRRALPALYMKRWFNGIERRVRKN